MVAMVLDYMGAAGIVDFAQPVLDTLARQTEEFVRLAVIEGEKLIWVARAQGARRGLRYDPDIDTNARLSCTASGHAWLMTMSDEQAVTLAARQGFGRPEDYGPNAPTNPMKLIELLQSARARGYSMTHDMFAPGWPRWQYRVARDGETPVGILSIAGPTVRLPPERLAELFPALRSAARDIAIASASSPLFASRRLVPDESSR